ncbi:hypothetical protein BU17DRAFT_62632 [Hysterangium stoloniferum]|nr:hypothetical protein BU17DRAFT_62632 [Hysterangium stoloniferum]
MTSTLFTMINKKRNRSSSPSYTPENPTATLYHFEIFTSHLLEEATVRINLKGPLKSTQSKFGAVVPTPSEPSPQLPKKAASTKRHGPSPPKRARLRPADAKRAVASPGHADPDPDPDANVFLDNGMDVDTEITPRSAIQRQGRAGAASDETNPAPEASAQPSPFKACAIIIIAGIEANTEIMGATQAQQE